MIVNSSKQSGNLIARQRIQADADRAPIDSTNIEQKQQSPRALSRQIDILASQHIRRERYVREAISSELVNYAFAVNCRIETILTEAHPKVESIPENG